MKTLTEAAFQKQVIQFAKLCGWTAAHFRRVRVQRANGSVYYETPAAADGAGFPDLVLVHPARGVLFVELKTDRGQLSEAQEEWLAALRGAGARAEVWKPRGWAVIQKILAGEV